LHLLPACLPAASGAATCCPQDLLHSRALPRLPPGRRCRMLDFATPATFHRCHGYHAPGTTFTLFHHLRVTPACRLPLRAPLLPHWNYLSCRACACVPPYCAHRTCCLRAHARSFNTSAVFWVPACLRLLLPVYLHSFAYACRFSGLCLPPHCAGLPSSVFCLRSALSFCLDIRTGLHMHRCCLRRTPRGVLCLPGPGPAAILCLDSPACLCLPTPAHLTATCTSGTPASGSACLGLAASHALPLPLPPRACRLPPLLCHLLCHYVSTCHSPPPPTCTTIPAYHCYLHCRLPPPPALSLLTAYSGTIWVPLPLYRPALCCLHHFSPAFSHLPACCRCTCTLRHLPPAPRLGLGARCTCIQGPGLELPLGLPVPAMHGFCLTTPAT